MKWWAQPRLRQTARIEAIDPLPRPKPNQLNTSRSSSLPLTGNSARSRPSCATPS